MAERVLGIQYRLVPGFARQRAQEWFLYVDPDLSQTVKCDWLRLRLSGLPMWEVRIPQRGEA